MLFRSPPSSWSLSEVSQTRALGCHCFQIRFRTPCVICCFSPFMHKKYFAEGSRKKLRSEYMQKCHSSKMDVQVSSSVSSVTQSCLTLCDPMDCSTQASLSIANSQSIPKLISIKLVMPSNHLILCRPLFLPPSIFPSIRVFSNEAALRIRWPKYWSFSFNISPSNEYPRLISFRMDWLDLLAVQGTFSSSHVWM